MTKGELIRFLEPFDDETEVKAVVNFNERQSLPTDIINIHYAPVKGDTDAYVYVEVE